MEILKSAVSLANDIKATRKNVANDFRINFCYVFVHAKKRLCQWDVRKCSIKEDFNQMTASFLNRI